MNHPTLLKEEEKKKSVLELAQVRSSLVFKQRKTRKAMVPFPGPVARQERLLTRGWLQIHLEKDGTEATSAKAARLPSHISQSGSEDVENKCSSARRYRVASTECNCNFTTVCTQLKCQDQAALPPSVSRWFCSQERIIFRNTLF